jgi:hypothetical protein
MIPLVKRPGFCGLSKLPMWTTKTDAEARPHLP